MRRIVLFSIFLVLYILNSVFASWEPLAELKAPDPCEGAYFGYSASTDGNFIAIGAPWENNFRGAVYIYEVNDLQFDYVTKLLPPELNSSRFGNSVCIDSNKIVVGTYYAKKVYVFDYDGQQWSNNPEILTATTSQGYFGCAVAMDGNTIVVGTSTSATQRGAAYVFDYNGTSWDYKQALTDPDGANGDKFGSAVAIDGDVIVVGAEYDTVSHYSEGSATVFRYDSGTWSHEQKLKNSEGDNSDQMGYSVAVSGDTFVAGVYSYTHGDNSNAGAAFVYKFNGTSWIKETTLYDPNEDISDRFGNSVAIDDDKIIVGERYFDGAATNSGAAFLFERNDGNWSAGLKLKNPSGASNDYFGVSVAIDGEVIIAGADCDDGGEDDSGAAFVFFNFVADLNQDSKINLEDFSILANQWLSSPSEPSADIAPANGSDGIVNIQDLAILTQYWLLP